MDEARKLKAILYPLSRNVRNLRTFIQNIHNILLAEPQRFAVAAPVGLQTVRNSVRTLNKATRAMKETTDIALQHSTEAASLALRTRLAVLRPAAHLNSLVRHAKPQVDRVHNSVLRIEGYLNPLFVFMAAMIPQVDAMSHDIALADERIQYFKKAVSRLADHELTGGLPGNAEKQMAVLVPQLTVIAQEAADISAQTGLLMGRMNRLQELSARLDVLVRMSVALDGALQDLVPAMSILKRLGSILGRVQKNMSMIDRPLLAQVEEALACLPLPADALPQLEAQLSRQMAQYIEPVAQPLQAVADTLRNGVMHTHELNGLESSLATQNARLGNVSKLLMRLFVQLEEAIREARRASHAA